jgi:hypothetical protein
MRALLLDRGVVLAPAHADNRETYQGPGAGALQAWEAFRAVAQQPATDPVQAWGELRAVEHAGFSFDARYVPGAEPDEWGRGETPEHYSLSFARYFSIGDAGSTKALTLTIVVSPSEDLRLLRAEHWEEGDPLADRDDPAVLATDAVAFASYVEADPAFQVPMAPGRASHFAFDVDDVG